MRIIVCSFQSPGPTIADAEQFLGHVVAYETG
ncbi:hypothetical protein M3J07_011058 [Ascochyta lentis]